MTIERDDQQIEMDFDEALEMDAKLVAKYMISLYD